jgi:hypothetical protein
VYQVSGLYLALIDDEIPPEICDWSQGWCIKFPSLHLDLMDDEIQPGNYEGPKVEGQLCISYPRGCLDLMIDGRQPGFLFSRKPWFYRSEVSQ